MVKPNSQLIVCFGCGLVPAPLLIPPVAYFPIERPRWGPRTSKVSGCSMQLYMQGLQVLRLHSHSSYVFQHNTILTTKNPRRSSTIANKTFEILIYKST